MKKIISLFILSVVIVIIGIILISCNSHECVFGEWQVEESAICTQDGTMKRACSCGEIQTKVIPAPGHTYGEWTVTAVATCTEDGHEERVCKCGEEVETRTIESKGAHDFQSSSNCAHCDSTIENVAEKTYSVPTTNNGNIKAFFVKRSGGLNSYGSEPYDLYIKGTGAISKEFCLRDLNGAPTSGVINAYVDEGITSIGSTFKWMYDLTSVLLPDGLEIIGDYAFSSCYKLQSVNIPDGVRSIGNDAFRNCDITDIVIPNSVTSIGEGAFAQCECLANITISSNLKELDSSAFVWTAYYEDSSNWQDGVLYIGNYLITTDFSIVNCAIKQGTTLIADDAFYSRCDLVNVTIPTSVISIGGMAFYNCTSLTSINIPQGVTSIGRGAFHSCSNLASINIPESVTEIGGYAFYSCYSLESIDFEGDKCWYVKDGTTQTYVDTSDVSNWLGIYETWGWYSDPEGHNYSEVICKPTCTDNGYTTHTCSACSHSYVDSEVTASGHTYESVVTDPTCTEKGYTTHTCSACSDSYVDSEVTASGHTYESVVTDPTCTEKGYTTHTCSVCSDSYVDSEVTASGHTYEWVIDLNATNESTGLKHEECTICHEKRNENTLIEIIPYQVKYNSNCEFEFELVENKYHNQEYYITESVPIRDGYRFVGWCNLFEDFIYEGNSLFVGNYDVEFFALWEEDCSHCNAEGVVYEQVSCDGCLGSGKTNHSASCTDCGGDGKKTGTKNCSACYGNGGAFSYSCWCGWSGSGWTYGTYCPRCGSVVYGSISWICSSCSGYGTISYTYTCSTCNGNGSVIKTEDCSICSGCGLISKVKTCPACDGRKSILPTEPTLELVEDSKIVLVFVEGYEYSIDGVNWQTSNVFENLISSTTYKLYQRVAGTESRPFGLTSYPLTVTTN